MKQPLRRITRFFRNPLPLLFIVCLMLLPATTFSQAKKPLSITLNPQAMVINGSSFTAASMLTGNLFKVLGTPERSDTLPDKQLKSFVDFSMARLNKYESRGLLLKQGRATDRVNSILIFLNPESKRYIDYVNTRYKGSLSILGMKIDSNTTIKKVQQFMAKQDFSLSEEYENATLTVYDPKNTDRLLEVNFNFSKITQKIEYLDIQYYPASLAKKHILEYKDKSLYIDNLLLDSAANKATQLKKILGSPNAVLANNMQSLNGQSIRGNFYYYDNISGVSFFENPVNNSVVYFKLNYLFLRKHYLLDNPLFQLLLNKKPFNPDQAVERKPEDLKTQYGFDSTIKTTSKEDKAIYMSVMAPSTQLIFQFASDYLWERRVYYVEYFLPAAGNKPVAAAVPQDITPGLYIKDGYVWMQKRDKKQYWNTSVPATAVFRDILGTPVPATSTVSTYPQDGLRMWARDDGKLSSIEFYMAEQINPYSKKNDAPGIFTGVVEIEGNKLTTATSLREVQELLPQYNLKKAYSNANHLVYEGTYSGVKIYFTFLDETRKLISVSVSY